MFAGLQMPCTSTPSLALLQSCHLDDSVALSFISTETHWVCLGFWYDCLFCVIVCRKDHEKAEFAVHEVYAVDVLVSTGEGKVNAYRCLFSRTHCGGAHR